MLKMMEIETIDKRVDEYILILHKLYEQIITNKCELVLNTNGVIAYRFKLFKNENNQIDIYNNGKILSLLDYKYLIKQFIKDKTYVVYTFTNYTNKFLIDDKEFYELWCIKVFIEENTNLVIKYVQVYELRELYLSLMENPIFNKLDSKQLIYRDNLSTLMELFM